MARKITLDKIVAMAILDKFKELQKTIRQEFAKGYHVMEFSQAVLRKNAPELHDSGITANKLFSIFLEERPDARPYKGEVITSENRELFYLRGRDRFAILAKSYGVIRSILTKMGKNPALKDVEAFSKIQVGHTAAFGKEERNTVQAARIMQALQAGGLSSSLVREIFDIFDKKFHEVHAPYKVRFSKNTSLTEKLVGKVDFIYTVPQDEKINRLLSSLERKIVTEFEKYIIDISSSPTIFENLLEQLNSAFQGRKLKSKKSVAVREGNIDLSFGNASVKTVKLKNHKKSLEVVSTLTLQNLINAKLHDYIKLNMGKGRAKETLNYRTGRFAKSAKVELIHQNPNREKYLDILYTYQRFPYDTFLPGGRLYKKGRDPRKIIGRSIRQIARDLSGNRLRVNPVLKDK